jgi:hypothetical protein
MVEMSWGSPVEVERHRRIKLSVAAYAYEVHSDSIMSDGNYDKLALQIDKSVSTDNEIMDAFFKKEFEPDTGQWIHKHPDLVGIERIYNKIKKVKKR